MDKNLIKHYKAIGDIQASIANATTMDEALQAGLKIIAETCGADSTVLWYCDKAGDGRLHPYYWIGDSDLTSLSFAPGEGIVGSVFSTVEPQRVLDFQAASPDEADERLLGKDIASLVCVPLSNDDGVLGCIQFIKRSASEPFSEEAADVCEIMVLLAEIAFRQNDSIQDPWVPGEVIMELRDIRREFQNGSEIAKVLKGVNLDVYKGEFLVLLGESGCGKTTLLNIMGGMDNPSDGTLTFMGEDYSHADDKALTEFRRSSVGFIFQSYNLMPNLNAIRNLQLIAELVDDPMDTAEALEIVGLADKKGNYPSQLSGGQQQRVSIARAIVKKPKIILADEPTAALDYETSIEVLQVLKKVVDSGTTLVMVTHNREIARMADRVISMRDGKMYETIINRHPADATELVW